MFQYLGILMQILFQTISTKKKKDLQVEHTVNFRCRINNEMQKSKGVCEEQLYHKT